LGSGQATDINTIFRHLATLTGYDLPEVHGPAKLGEVHTIYLDASLARQELRWEPTVPLVEGLMKTVDYFRLEAEKRH